MRLTVTGLYLFLVIFMAEAQTFKGGRRHVKYTYEEVDSLTKREAQKTVTHDGCMLIAYLDWCEGCYSKPDKKHRRINNPFSITFIKFDGEHPSKGFVDNYGNRCDEIMNDTSLLSYAKQHFKEIKNDTLKPDTTFDSKGRISTIHSPAIFSSDGPIRRISIYKWQNSLSYEYMLPVSEMLTKGYKYKYFQMLENTLSSQR
jgi:hypothetical protein